VWPTRLEAAQIMPISATQLTGLATALGIGLLIGLERERRKSSGGGRAPGGVRTFPIAAMLGAIAEITGGSLILATAIVSVDTFATISYLRAEDSDPGITTEIALVLTVMLGGLAVMQPAVAVGVGVVASVLLAARGDLHRFARDTLTEIEIRDGLILATAALVVWPLLPDRAIDPLGALNLKNVWALVVLLMAVGSTGYVGMRVFGPKLGLVFVGFASGFVSSTATIGTMGERAKNSPDLLLPAVAGAMLSTVATFVLLAVVLAVVSLPSLVAVLPALIAGGLASIIYGGVFTRQALSGGAIDTSAAGQAFDPKVALLFAGLISTVLLLTAVLNKFLGASGAMIGAAVAGLADSQSAAAAVANLVKTGQLEANTAVLPIIAGVSTNTISKIVAAVAGGDRAYAKRVVPGLIFVIACVWLGALL
jgi:uncharacterized membrane protein (DUF4010 family)